MIKGYDYVNPTRYWLSYFWFYLRSLLNSGMAIYRQDTIAKEKFKKNSGFFDFRLTVHDTQLQMFIYLPGTGPRAPKLCRILL